MIPQSDIGYTQSGFRLQYLEVLNWGTFDRVYWQLQPNGFNALLTGDIGSGKSTLVDALTCLLVRHDKIVFNKAAGAESKERSLLSYVKGEYKKEKEEITKAARKIYLRPDDNTYSVIIGNFWNQGYDEHVCLAQVFWIGKDAKVEKMLLISTEPLHIPEHFGNFTDISELRKRLRQRNSVQSYNDNFSQYSEAFRRLLGMNSDKAVDLFYQTVSMKAVSSLTSFVRDQMLERTDVKEQITALLKRFDDLNKSHDAVKHAREQYEILKPLTESIKNYDLVSADIEKTEAMMEAAPAWFANLKRQLLEVAITESDQQLYDSVQLQSLLAREKEELDKKKLGILQDIDNNGGKRLEQIASDISQQQEHKESKKSEWDKYDRLASQCGLATATVLEIFKSNIVKAKLQEEDARKKESEFQERRDNIVSELRRHTSDLETEQGELDSLKERKTQIPAWLIGFRTQLCSDLQLDEQDLPFAGELLKVRDNEADWGGAVEKLLRDTGISLIVSPTHYRSVSKYVNDNPLKGPDGRGIKLTYLEATTAQTFNKAKDLEEQSLFYKLEIKPDTSFYEWIEQYLKRSFGDYLCVNDVSELKHIPFGITRQGLIKSGRIRYTKDDRRNILDRRNYVLGWTNAEKIKALETSIQLLKRAVADLESKKNGLEDEQKHNTDLRQWLVLLLNFTDYSKINWQFHAEKINELEGERNELLHNKDILALLNSKKEDVEGRLKDCQERERKAAEDTGGLKNRLNDLNGQLNTIKNILEQVPNAICEKWYPVIQARMAEYSPTLVNVDLRQEEFRKQVQGSNGEVSKMKTRQTNLRSEVENAMRTIKTHSKAEYDELAGNIDARAEYMQRFEKLVTEDLKRHEERFKMELNKNTINSIAVFDSQLEKHEKEIKEKIKTINRHLNDIVYNSTQDTYITILMDPTPNSSVRLFKEELKRCYTHSFSSNSELYTEEKYEQVKKILDRFASADPAEKDWTNTVTDVRQWFEFNASERYRVDNAEKEFYEGSGGKSGGQKEKLAYTILASALAYQFGLQFGESKSRSFRFVVIDEAFGRGSDESTRYGLELFKKLDLQLLIVTPLQKIHVIENHVNSFHFVSNREGNNSQLSNFTKQEYDAEKLLRTNRFKAKEIDQ